MPELPEILLRAQEIHNTLRDELNIRSFDSGFPVDFAWLRRELGPEVEILGGPPVAPLLHGAPQAVYDATKEILLSGIKEGGRFVLREGNNLPPCVRRGIWRLYIERVWNMGGTLDVLFQRWRCPQAIA